MKALILLAFLFGLHLGGCHPEHNEKAFSEQPRQLLRGFGQRRFPCGTAVPTNESRNVADAVFQKWLSKREAVGMSSDSQPFDVVKVKTYVHVIRGESSGRGAVSLDRVNRTIEHLNESFNGTGFQFEFVGATCTTNALWFNAGTSGIIEKIFKRNLRVGNAATLNVYVKNFIEVFGSRVGGYATLPSSYRTSPRRDGVAMFYDLLTGGPFSGHREGDTLVHELGHWLGLYHTFSDGLPTCLVDNDGVDDTPRERSPEYGCPTSRDSCPLWPGSDPIHNFMSYTNDRCQSEFTKGQVERMHAQWDEFRASDADLEFDDGLGLEPFTACD